MSEAYGCIAAVEGKYRIRNAQAREFSVTEFDTSGLSVNYTNFGILVFRDCIFKVSFLIGQNFGRSVLTRWFDNVRFGNVLANTHCLENEMEVSTDHRMHKIFLVEETLDILLKLLCVLKASWQEILKKTILRDINGTKLLVEARITDLEPEVSFTLSIKEREKLNTHGQDPLRETMNVGYNPVFLFVKRGIRGIGNIFLFLELYIFNLQFRIFLCDKAQIVLNLIPRFESLSNLCELISKDLMRNLTSDLYIALSSELVHGNCDET